MSGEKTLAPTEKRKRDAALKGDVLRSRDLATAVAMLAGTMWLKFAGPWLLDTLVQSTRRGLTWDRGAIIAYAHANQWDQRVAQLLRAFDGILGANVMPAERVIV